MKQELTTEQKARVYAQHIGCEIITSTESEPNEEGETIPAGSIGKLSLVNIGNLDIRCSDDSENWNLGVDFPFCSYADWISSGLFKLLLRPIHSILDVHAAQVAKIINEPIGNYLTSVSRDTQDIRIETSLDVVCIIRFRDCKITFNSRGYIPPPSMRYAAAYDYLRQMGYAVPSFIAPGHPCNGMTAIEMGLAIDSTKS